MSTYFLNKTAANRVSSATERINEQFPSRSTPTVMKASTPTVCLRSGGRRELAQSPMDPQTSIFQVAIGQQQLEKSKGRRMEAIRDNEGLGVRDGMKVSR